MVFVLVRLCYYTYLEATEKNYKSILKLIEELIKQVDEFFQKTDLILEFPVVTFWRQLVPTFLSLSNWLIFWFMIKIILLQHHLIDNKKPTNTHRHTQWNYRILFTKQKQQKEIRKNELPSSHTKRDERAFLLRDVTRPCLDWKRRIIFMDPLIDRY